MRKFTKQISTLIALATAVSANPSIVTAESVEDISYMGGIAPYTEEIATPTAGVMMYTEPEVTPLMGDVYYTYETTTYETTTEFSCAGAFMNTDDYYWETTPNDYYNWETNTTTTYDMPIGTFMNTDYEHWGTLESTTTTALGTWVESNSNTFTTNQEVYTPFYGDIDLNGKITNSDLVLICQVLIQDVELNDEQKKAADINKDGENDIADAALIKSHLLGDDVPNIDVPIITTTEYTNEYTFTTTEPTTTTYDMPIGTFIN